MKCSLLISTYNRPEALRLCLMSIAEQVVLPNEIVIADDGSTEATALLIKYFQNEFSFPVHHIWQKDEGFRLAGIRNKGISAATGEYIIQIDGDLILHKHFIADHIKMKRKNMFITGSRVLLSPASTNMLLNHQSIDIKKWGKSKKNLMNSFRNNFISQVLAERYKTKGVNKFYVKGCNMAFWKTDLLKVNGYNEDFIGWGREDSEIAIRLINAGVKKRFIKMGAVCYHLYHHESEKTLEPINRAMMEEAITKKIIKAKQGLNKYLEGKE